MMGRLLKRRRKELVLLFSVVFICILIAEAGLRLAFPDPYLQHPVYGWNREGGFNYTKEYEDSPGQLRLVNVSFEEHGFKRWGDVNTSKAKVLIIGDSFTEMVYVSNGEEWYSYLEKEFPDAEFFVSGTGGYGTLQEYLVLRDYYDVIRPDVIIWQFYFNDFQNNYFGSELYAYPSTNKVKRPFLEDGDIRLKLPVPLGWLRDKSRLAGMALSIYDGWRERDLADRDLFYSHLYGDTFWDEDFANSKVFLGRFDEIYSVTNQIFSMVRERAGDTPIYFFSADNRLEQYERMICNSTDLVYIDGVHDALLARDEVSNVFVVNDGHWNLEGNRVVGEFLVSYFKENGALD